MPLYPCPKGHSSTESDYCSDCGTRLGAASSAPSDLSGTLGAAIAPGASASGAGASGATGAGSSPCPACGTPHAPSDGIFCEICGYNFKTQVHGELPIASIPAPTPVPPPLEIPLAPVILPIPLDLQPSSVSGPIAGSGAIDPTTRPGPPTWQLEITIDPSLAYPESPPAPSQAPIVLVLTKPSNLIGRTSAAKANYPDIALDFDDAVSHRHAVVTIGADQSLTLRDIGSSNGTYVNGIEIKPMVDIQLKLGDVFNLGHWTKLTVQTVP